MGHCGLERSRTNFTKLNHGWNAEPNAPMSSVRVEGTGLAVTFYLNPWLFPDFKEGDCGELHFAECWRYRLGATDDEGWWRGQCRFSRRAPDWGEFYEVEGDLRLERLPEDSWILLAEPSTKTRHFLFYFRDETFECDAGGWSLRVLPAVGGVTAGWRKVTLSSGSSVSDWAPRRLRRWIARFRSKRG